MTDRTRRLILLSCPKDDVVVNEDGSVDLYLRPEPPPGMERNWIQSKPGEGLKLWRPGDPERL